MSSFWKQESDPVRSNQLLPFSISDGDFIIQFFHHISTYKFGSTQVFLFSRRMTIFLSRPKDKSKVSLVLRGFDTGFSNKISFKYTFEFPGNKFKFSHPVILQWEMHPCQFSEQHNSYSWRVNHTIEYRRNIVCHQKELYMVSEFQNQCWVDFVLQQQVLYNPKSILSGSSYPGWVTTTSDNCNLLEKIYSCNSL